MALIDISCIFSEFTTTGEFPDSFLITPFVTIAQLEFKKQKTFTIKKKFLLSRYFFLSKLHRFCVSTTYPYRNWPGELGSLGRNSGRERRKDRKNLSVDHSDIIKYSSLHLKNSRKTFLDIMVIKNKITSQVNRFPLKINDRLSD